MRVDSADVLGHRLVWVRDAHGRITAARFDVDPADLAPDAETWVDDEARAAIDAWRAGDDGPLMALPVSDPTAGFAAQVRHALRRIPAGEPMTYGALAALVGSPGAARAVGQACATNPILFFVPCHRVLPSSGGVGGYADGAELKSALLGHEGQA